LRDGNGSRFKCCYQYKANGLVNSVQSDMVSVSDEDPSKDCEYGQRPVVYAMRRMLMC